MAFTLEEYERIRDGVKKSAAVVVPAVYEMVKPETVVDVGGGEGWWAREFAIECGCSCLVLDESAPEAADQKVWPGEEPAFHHFNLTGDAVGILTPPSGRFDLALCLEVAEHIPEEHADNLITLLKQLAPVVLFSAAIPGQGGLGHVNEQWPDYWATKFQSHENGQTYFVIDAIRWLFWGDDRVEPWYRQNMMWAVEAGHPLLGNVKPDQYQIPRRVVHPDIFGWRVAERDQAVKLTDGFTWTGP